MRGLLVIVGALALGGCGGSVASLGGADGGDGGGSSSGGSSSGSSSGGSSSGGSSSGSGGSSSSSSSSGGSSSSSGGSSGSSGGSSSSGSSSGGSSGGRVPVNHRPNDGECSQPAPPGMCPVTGGGPPNNCTQDSQCTQGVDGRCVTNNGGALFCYCTYDTCMHDTDCAQGQTCACHGAADTGGAGNTCIASGCRVDADCGPGGYCSPSVSSMGCGGLGGYYCHTAKDQCIDDSDCQDGGFGMACEYSSANGRWQCAQLLLCG